MSIDIPEFPQTVGIPSLPTPGALTLTAGLAYESGYLTQATRETFDYDGGRTVTATANGWTVFGWDKVSAADENTTLSGALTFTHEASSSALSNTVQTAPRRGRAYPRVLGYRQTWLAFVVGDDAANDLFSGIFCHPSGTATQPARIALKLASSVDKIDTYDGKNNTGPTNATPSAGTVTAGIWFGFSITGRDLEIVYAEGSVDTVPDLQSMTLDYTISNFFASEREQPVFGVFSLNFPGTPAFDTTVKRIVDEGMNPLQSEINGTSKNWAATQIETSLIQTGLYYDFGFENRKPTDAQLRQWLGDAENHQVWATAAPTYRLTWGTGGHAGSGSFAASGSAASSGTGAVLHVEITFTSDGTTRGSFDMRQAPPIAA